MSGGARVVVELVDGGFIVETLVDCASTHKRVHVSAYTAADDVRGRLIAHESAQSKRETEKA